MLARGNNWIHYYRTFHILVTSFAINKIHTDTGMLMHTFQHRYCDPTTKFVHFWDETIDEQNAPIWQMIFVNCSSCMKMIGLDQDYVGLECGMA